MHWSVVRVLVVEPDEHDYTITRELLQEPRFPRFSVTRAKTLKEAMHQLDVEQIDAILLELSVQGNRGFEAVQILHAKADAIPLIVFSQFADDEIGAQAINCGAEDYLAKGDTDSRSLAKALLFALTRRARPSGAVVGYAGAGSQGDPGYEDLFHHSPNPIVVTDVSGTIRLWSRSAERLFGWTTRDASGKKLFELLHTQAEQSLKHIEQSVLRDGAWSGQLRHIGKDGSIITVAERCTLKIDQWGRPTAVIHSCADITRLKLIEQALREGETLFRDMAGSVDYVLYFASKDLDKLYYVNEVYEQLWCSTRESLYKNPTSFMERIHPEDRRNHVNLAIEERKQTGFLDQEYRIVRSDGETRLIWDRAFPVRGANGQVERVCGYAQDVTGRLQRRDPMPV